MEKILENIKNTKHSAKLTTIIDLFLLLGLMVSLIAIFAAKTHASSISFIIFAFVLSLVNIIFGAVLILNSSAIYIKRKIKENEEENASLIQQYKSTVIIFASVALLLAIVDLILSILGLVVIWNLAILIFIILFSLFSMVFILSIISSSNNKISVLEELIEEKNNKN